MIFLVSVVLFVSSFIPSYGIWEKHLDGQILSVDSSSDGAFIAAGTDINDSKGKIYYLNKNGNLLWSAERDRIISEVSVSPDGSSILASGYQLVGRGGFYSSPSVYMYDKMGNLLWVYQNENKTGISTDNQFLTGAITNTNNIVIGTDDEILYLDYNGKLLWNYNTTGSLTKILTAKDNSVIVAGATGFLDNSWHLYVLDTHGNLLWGYDGFDGLVQGRAIALSAGGQLTAIGSMISGEYGDLYLFDKKGNLLWSKKIDGGVLSIDMSNNGKSIIVQTNLGTILFDEFGNQISTKFAFYPAISSDGSMIVGVTPVMGMYDLKFFDHKLNQTFSEKNFASAIGDIHISNNQIVIGTRQQDNTGKSGILHIFENIPLKKELSPLQQFKSGISINEIQCKEGLELIIKSSDGSPACVRDETKARLIGVGWMKTQIDVHDELAFIDSTKDLDEVHLFLTMHPDAKVSVNHEWHTVTYEESGFRKHPSSNTILHTKRLIISLDYDGKPVPDYAECGGSVSLVGPVELLTNADWCFPLDQTPFASLDKIQNE